MPSFGDVPLEVLLHHLRPLINLQDLLSLARTNNAFARIVNDETFWKQRVKQDFHFFNLGIVRREGWKEIYGRLCNPELFVWGHNANGRLGEPVNSDSGQTSKPYPTPFRIPEARIIAVAAGGWSFHALDSKGQLWVWGKTLEFHLVSSLIPSILGALNGEDFAVPEDSFSKSGKWTEYPMRLQLPVTIRSVSCSRAHSIALDSNGNVWTFISWGRPYRIKSPLLNGTSPETTIKQLESGWHVSLALMESGDILLWNPFGRRSQERIKRTVHELGIDVEVDSDATNDGVIPCVTWDFEQQLYRLPPIPLNLPVLRNSDKGEEVKFIMIAGMVSLTVVGLTNKGHVLKFVGSVGRANADDVELRGQWVYLDQFSETRKIREHPVYSEGHIQLNRMPLEAPRDLRITHISANRETFIAYTVGPNCTVLLGRLWSFPFMPATTKLKIIPSLQNSNIVSVVLGDNHYGALTGDGRFFTWGRYREGNLGLGDPRDIEIGQPGGYGSVRDRNRARFGQRIEPPYVEVPTEVMFDHAASHGQKKEYFCVAATAGGLHTGALIIRLDLETG